MNKLIPCVLMATFSAAAVAQGQPAQGQPTQPTPGGSPAQSQPGAAMTFQSLDKNSDQKISKTEAAMDRMLNQSFTALDANGDGSLNVVEFAAHNARGNAPSSPRSDTPGAPRSDSTTGTPKE